MISRNRKTEGVKPKKKTDKPTRPVEEEMITFICDGVSYSGFVTSAEPDPDCPPLGWVAEVLLTVPWPHGIDDRKQADQGRAVTGLWSQADSSKVRLAGIESSKPI